MSEQDIAVGAIQVPAPSGPRTLVAAKKKAARLVREAKALETGERQCKAIRKDGTRCKRFAIKGGFVCPTHGGSAPQVKSKAAKRLLAMVEPSIIRLEALVHQSEHLPTALAAVRTVLERAGANPIGAMAKDTGERDTRPVINIGIKVGGIDLPAVTVALPEPASEGEVIGSSDDDDD